MGKKIRYQAKFDLKIMRQLSNLTKDNVAEEIGYTTRSLERMERENAVTSLETVNRLCRLYRLECNEQFYYLDFHVDDLMREQLSHYGRKPRGGVNANSKHYYLYVRKTGYFRDCILGKGLWIADYNKNKEVRKLREIDISIYLQLQPNIEIINDGEEWDYWYYRLCIGKMNKVIVSEKCMKERLINCLDEVIIDKNRLMSYDGTTDLMFLGIKKRK